MIKYPDLKMDIPSVTTSGYTSQDDEGILTMYNHLARQKKV